MARVVNALLVRWSEGWLEVEDAASILAHDRHEDFLSVGDAQSAAEAERVAVAVLAVRAWPSEETVVGIEPDGDGDVPYLDFGVGDVITVPDSSGVPTLCRVVGITVTADEEGFPVYAPTVQPVE